MARNQDLGNQSLENSANWQTLVDEPSSTVTYVGRAKHGIATSDAKWQIQKILVTGTVTSIQFVNSDDGFEYVWDDRDTYSYA